MNLNFILLFCAISLFNVIMQTVKSLCTVRCSTFVAACVNALTYAVYVYVIVYTNAEGLTLWGKALITAGANFVGVYIANFFFNKLFTKEVAWTISISVPKDSCEEFEAWLNDYHIPYHDFGYNEDMAYVLLDIYCTTKQDSKNVKAFMPKGCIYNIIESRKRL